MALDAAGVFNSASKHYCIVAADLFAHYSVAYKSRLAQSVRYSATACTACFASFLHPAYCRHRRQPGYGTQRSAVLPRLVSLYCTKISRDHGRSNLFH